MPMDYNKTRYTTFLRLKKDDDVRDFLAPMLEHNDFSAVIRDCVRELMRYRAGEVFLRNTSSISPEPQKPVFERKKRSVEDFKKEIMDF